MALHLYEDLASLARSSKLMAAVAPGDRVVNLQNRRRGVKARRGDATFGELIPGETAQSENGFSVGRGAIATVEIGVEVMIDRVINDLRNQTVQFRVGGGNPISVGIVGINEAEHYLSYEGDRQYRTTGKDGYVHPFQEAPEAERRLRAEAAPAYDEFLVLRYRATNEAPYLFEWVNYEGSRKDYAAALARISSAYQRRF